MGKSSKPSVPNYEALAREEAQGNLELARYATQANRVNQYTPWGSMTWTNDRAFDQAGYDAAMAAYNQSMQPGAGGQPQYNALGLPMAPGYDAFGMPLTASSAAAYSNRPAPAMPNPDDFYSAGDNWSQTVTLSPQMQQMLDQQNRIQLGLFGAQDAALGRVNESMATPFSTAGMPSGGAALNIGSLPGLGDVLDHGSLPAMGEALDIGRLPAMGSVLNINSLPQAGTAFTPTGQQLAMYDPTLATNNATELIMQRINPQMDQQQEALRAQLANQGIVQGTEAYDRALMQHQQGRNDAYNQAALAGINLGMQQQGLQFNQGLQNRQLTAAEQAQQFGQQGYLRELAAQLQAQQYGQQTGNRVLSAAEQAQRYGQLTNNRMMGTAEQAQRFGQQTTNQQLAAALQQQQFAQSEAARQRAFQEAAYQRGLPFQELMALTGGGQVQMPNFPSYSQQATTGGANLLGAANAGYQGALGAANAQNAASSNMMSGLFGLGSSAIGAGLFGGTGLALGSGLGASLGGTMAGSIGTALTPMMALSDRRLKTNVRKVGVADNGLNIYQFNYVWGGPPQLGYMAQEVEQVAPHAVGDVDGIKFVNYGAL